MDSNPAPPSEPPKAAPPAGSGCRLWMVGVVLGCVGLTCVGGCVAAIVVPNFLDALQKARVRRTQADLRALGERLESYRSENGTYPPATTIAGLIAALGKLEGMETPALDGWRNPIRYSCWSDTPGLTCDTFRLVSAGRGGVFEQDDPHAYQPHTLEPGDYDSDIVLAPEGLYQATP